MRHLEAVWRCEEGDWRTQPQRRDVEVVRRAALHQPTLRRCQDSIDEIFLDITKRRRKQMGRRNEIRDGDSRDRVIVVFCIFFLELLVFKTQ